MPLDSHRIHTFKCAPVLMAGLLPSSGSTCRLRWTLGTRAAAAAISCCSCCSASVWPAGKEGRGGSMGLFHVQCRPHSISALNTRAAAAIIRCWSTLLWPTQREGSTFTWAEAITRNLTPLTLGSAALPG